VATRAPAVRSHVLTIPDLPSVSGLVVVVGERVAEGELIARYVDNGALEVFPRRDRGGARVSQPWRRR
jgi:inner membrane protein